MGNTSSMLTQYDIEEVQEHCNNTFSQQEIVSLYQRFCQLDRNSGGFISADEFLSVPEFAVNPLSQRLFRMIDGLNFKEFVAFLSAFSSRATLQHKVEFIFKVYDSDGNGKVAFSDLLDVLRDLTGQFISEQQRELVLTQVLEEAGYKKDSLLVMSDFMKFCHLVTDSKWTTIGSCDEHKHGNVTVEVIHLHMMHLSLVSYQFGAFNLSFVLLIPPKKDHPPLEETMAAMAADISKLLESQSITNDHIMATRTTSSPQLNIIVKQLAAQYEQTATLISTIAQNNARNNQPPPNNPPPPLHGLQIRPPKLNLPTFDGSNPLDWFFLADQYFTFDNIAPPQRLSMIAFHLTRDALSWYKFLATQA
ncbi:EF-hand domain pair [Artemisia annua]|uniref:EF-hand domain pair n=1 Tax=Artemisia annua TaxID=35608 RepID=A0A2U1P5N1_ARTAN|nr:EF-hand domain pair [Artemisia annua]